MNKFFYALEKKTRQGYRVAREDINAAILKMSAQEIADNKRELMLLSNILALPEEVDMEDFKPPKLFTVDPDGTANIQAVGILSTQVDWCAAFFQEAITTYGFIRAAALAADEDPEVEKIRFIVDTPGGIVTDLDITSQVIANLTKPTETLGRNMIASAGIYLFSQTDKIISADPSTFFGSIGVAVSFIDRSKRDKAEGVERVELASDDAPDKRPDLSTDEGRQVIIKELNDLHNVFVSRVAVGRKVSKEFVNKNFGQGGVLIAEDALKVGLIDQIDNQIQASEPAKKSVTRSSAKTENPKTEVKMSLDTYLAENPAEKVVYDQRLKDAKAEGKKDGIEAKQAEIDRIHPLISAKGASKPLVESGFKALKGESSVDSFVAIADYETRVQAEKESKLADEEGKEQEETPAGQTQKSTDGTIRNSEDLEEEKALFNQMKGKKEEAKQ